MRITQLEASWIGDGDVRHGMGLHFLCPNDGEKHGGFAVWFKQPLDGGAPIKDKPLWDRSGDTFEAITLSPSIRVVDAQFPKCHFYLRNGELVPA